VLGFGVTALGFLAPWFPEAELINHFRPYVLAGALLLLGAAVLQGSRRLVRGAMLLVATTLALTLLPLAYRADSAADGTHPFKVVTLNLWDGNGNVDAVARFLGSESADVVVLQESDRLQGALIERVRHVYPHSYCPDRTCSLAILTRTPPLEFGREDVPPRSPLLVWARILHAGRPVTVMGVHVSYPFEPQRQVEHVDWLIGYLRQRSGPTVIAGDFNLTPFSWKLLKLLHQTGLRAHVIDRFTWPAHRGVPLVLLDNVLSTPDLVRVAARIGPAAGSDHRSVIAELAWR
jgi:endonuclease/exonuclease/phosphatase (EEP) superfamily protein YafD